MYCVTFLPVVRLGGAVTPGQFGSVHDDRVRAVMSRRVREYLRDLSGHNGIDGVNTYCSTGIVVLFMGHCGVPIYALALADPVHHGFPSAECRVPVLSSGDHDSDCYASRRDSRRLLSTLLDVQHHFGWKAPLCACCSAPAWHGCSHTHLSCSKRDLLPALSTGSAWISLWFLTTFRLHLHPITIIAATL